jgi:hypothetical protein
MAGTADKFYLARFGREFGLILKNPFIIHNPSIETKEV